MILKSDRKCIKVADDDPNRCQALKHGNQCFYRAIPGTPYCPMHNRTYNKQTRIRNMKNYLLTKFKARATQLSESENITALHDEVAILRMLVEERINRCTDTSELLMVSGPLSDLTVKIEKLVTSMTKLEEKQGNTLNRDKIIQFAQIVIEIISNYVENEEVLDAIGEDILKAITDISHEAMVQK